MSIAAAASSYNYREVVSTENAPGAVGPYSQGIKTSGLIFVSGQVGLIPGVSHCQHVCVTSLMDSLS